MSIPYTVSNESNDLQHKYSEISGLARKKIKNFTNILP